jgi:hypothetical protein
MAVVELQAQFVQEQGLLAGDVASLSAIKAALPDAALVAGIECAHCNSWPPGTLCPIVAANHRSGFDAGGLRAFGLLLETTRHVEFGYRLTVDIARDDLDVEIAFTAVGQHHAVARCTVEQLGLFAADFEGAVKRFPSLLFVAVHEAVHLIDDQLVVLKDLAANTLDFIHG